MSLSSNFKSSVSFSPPQKNEQKQLPTSNRQPMPHIRRSRRWWMWRGCTLRREHWKRPRERTLNSAWAFRATWPSCGSARARWGTPRCPKTAGVHQRARTARQTFTRPPLSKGNPPTAALLKPEALSPKRVSQTMGCMYKAVNFLSTLWW